MLIQVGVLQRLKHDLLNGVPGGKHVFLRKVAQPKLAARGDGAGIGLFKAAEDFKQG